MGDHVYGDQVYCTSVPADVIVVELLTLLVLNGGSRLRRSSLLYLCASICHCRRVTNFVGIEWGITFTEIKFTVPLCQHMSLSSSH